MGKNKQDDKNVNAKMNETENKNKIEITNNIKGWFCDKIKIDFHQINSFKR